MEMGRQHTCLDRRQWEAARRAALARDKHRCCQCGKAGRLEVDHLTPLDRGGALYALANLQTLCRRCHMVKTDRENPGDPDRRNWRAYINAMARGKFPFVNSE